MYQWVYIAFFFIFDKSPRQIGQIFLHSLEAIWAYGLFVIRIRPENTSNVGTDIEKIRVDPGIVI